MSSSSLQKLSSEMMANLKTVIINLSGVVNIVFAVPDPDAFGAALGVKLLIESLNTEVQVFIYYGGYIGYPQDVKLCNEFSLHDIFIPISQLDIASAKNIILVDSSMARDMRIADATPLNPVMVFDHHQRGLAPVYDSQEKFYLIEEVGASSTLVLECLEHFDITLENHHPVALCAAVGIYTDTEKMRNATHRDRLAWTWALSFVEDAEFAHITNFTVERSFFERMASSVRTLETQGAKAVACVGVIPPQEKDDIAIIATQLVRCKDWNFVLVWGVLQDDSGGRIIRFSVRVRGESDYNLGDFMNEYLKAKHSSGFKIMPDGGMQGGGTIQLGVFETLNDRKVLLKAISALITQQVFSSAL